MICPKDNAALIPESRFTIEVDVCPKCHGVWLDRDELNKILTVARGGRVQNPTNAEKVGDGITLGANAAPGTTGGSGGGGGIADFLGDIFGNF